MAADDFMEGLDDFPTQPLTRFSHLQILVETKALFDANEDLLKIVKHDHVAALFPKISIKKDTGMTIAQSIKNMIHDSMIAELELLPNGKTDRLLAEIYYPTMMRAFPKRGAKFINRKFADIYKRHESNDKRVQYQLYAVQGLIDLATALKANNQ